MKSLPIADRKKLAKLLGLLGSEHPGERDAAGLAAHRMVTAAGLSWLEVLRAPLVEKKLPELGTWRQTARDCLARPGELKPWERKFLEDLPQFPRISVKQRYCLKIIAARVLRREAAR